MPRPRDAGVRAVVYLLAGVGIPYGLALLASQGALFNLARADTIALAVATFVVGVMFACALFGWKPTARRIAAACIAVFCVSFSANDFILMKEYWVVVLESAIVAIVVAVSGVWSVG